ncbi:MAG: BMP family ABC transporter substrate-binding protein [Caldilineaceae bacterium]
MSRRLATIFTVLAALMLLAACPAAAPTAAPAAEAPAADAKATEAPAAEAPAAGTPLKVINFINGVLGDKSFFDSAERGMKMAKDELGIEYKTIEAGVDPTAWESALKDTLENEDFDVLIVGTFQMNGFLTDLADKYPDKKFIIYDAPVDYTKCKCANVYSITYKQNEGSYLAGVYAAAMTTQKIDGMNADAIIGSVGGQEIPVILDFMVGYEQGAKSVNKDIQVIRQFAGGWNDPAKGKELAKAQYSQGADIVFQIAGGTGQGVFEAAAEDGHFAIGVDSDQAEIIKDSDPKQAERILTSMKKNVDNSLLRALKMTIDGSAPYGKTEALGIAEGGVGLARNEFYDKTTPDDVKAAVDAAEKAVTAGEVKVDTAFQ